MPDPTKTKRGEIKVVTHLIEGKFRILQTEAVRGGSAVHDSFTYNTKANIFLSPLFSGMARKS
jgi:hypothetical protein